MTLIDLAKNNKPSKPMEIVCRNEQIPMGLLRQKILQGKIVIPNNNRKRLKNICGIGEGLRTKINTNIGTSSDKASLGSECKKLRIAVKYGTDTVMDLSVGGNIAGIRKAIIKKSIVPVGTVPIYEAAADSRHKSKSFSEISADDILGIIESQAEEGVDFMTIHAGVTRRIAENARKSKRILDVVSRGGAILVSWILRNKKENPFYEHFDKILEIARKYDVTLSLGDGLRPGSIIDATDSLQISELKILGHLAKRARQKNVQVIIEGPGHIPLNQIIENVRLQKKICAGAPFYVLGPLVTDIGSTKDHISAAIGGALAASYGADFLCVVTPAEHLRHPSIDDIKEGVISARIAAHSADIAKGIKGAADWDRQISIARKKRNWEKQIKLSIDPEKARAYRKESLPHVDDVCTMCSEYCSIKLMDECLKK